MIKSTNYDETQKPNRSFRSLGEKVLNLVMIGGCFIIASAKLISLSMFAARLKYVGQIRRRERIKK